MITEKQYVPFSRHVEFIRGLGHMRNIPCLSDHRAQRYFKLFERRCAGTVLPREIGKYVPAIFVTILFCFSERLQYYFMEQSGNEQKLTKADIWKSDMTGERRKIGTDFK